ncbi:hypothetical protein PHLH4_11520 [Pseudomonas sp. St316]|nr:hypothetical protein PHLH4_11520 [Pseudomonas sp. St316]
MKCLSAAGRGVASVLLFASLLAGPTTASALTQEISALFRPDPAKPTENKFTNTTPVSGYCAQYSAQCASTNMFSIRMPIIFNSSRPIEANHVDSRQGAMFRMPTDWRPVTVNNSSTGESEEVEIRISGVGSQYRLNENPIDLVGGAWTLSRRISGSGAAVGYMHLLHAVRLVLVTTVRIGTHFSGRRHRQALVTNKPNS